MGIPSAWSTRKTCSSPKLPARRALSSRADSKLLAERLLEGQPAAGSEPGSSEPVDGRREEARRQGEIDGERALLGSEGGSDRIRVAGIELPVVQAPEQRLARRRRNVAAVAFELLVGESAKRSVVPARICRSDDLEAVGQLPGLEQGGQRGKQVTPGEVAARAEQNQTLEHGHLARELANRPAADARAHEVEGAGGRLLVGREVLARGGDEELVEAGAAEGAGGDLARADLDDGLERSPPGPKRRTRPRRRARPRRCPRRRR